MLKLFDYIFYRVCAAYSKTKDSSPEGAAMCVVSLIQCLVILDLFFVFALLQKDRSIVNYPIAIVTAIFIIVFNYIRYIYREKQSYQVLEEKWQNESQKKEKGALVLFVIAFSLAIFIGLAIYTGRHIP